jgi:hypothetical protein
MPILAAVDVAGRTFHSAERATPQQRADRPEIDQPERVRIRSLANALFNPVVGEPDRAADWRWRARELRTPEPWTLATFRGRHRAFLVQPFWAKKTPRLTTLLRSVMTSVGE